MSRCPRRSALFNTLASVTLACVATFASLPAHAQTVTGNLSGQVVDEKREPVPTAIVTVTGSNLLQPRKAAVDEGGRFFIIAIPPGEQQIAIVDTEGRLEVSVQTTRIRIGETTELGAVTLRPPGAGEKPLQPPAQTILQNAMVPPRADYAQRPVCKAASVSAWLAVPRDSVTRTRLRISVLDAVGREAEAACPTEDGIIRVDRLSPGRHILRITDPAGCWESLEVPFHAHDKQLTELLAVNMRYADSCTGALAGRVTDETGEPIPDAIVTVESADLLQPRKVAVDHQGRFQLAGLPSGEAFISVFDASGNRAQTTGAAHVAAGSESVVGPIVLLPAGSPHIPPDGAPDAPKAPRFKRRDQPQPARLTWRDGRPAVVPAWRRFYRWVIRESGTSNAGLSCIAQGVPVRTPPERGTSPSDALKLLPGHRRAMSPPTNANCPLGRRPV